MARAYPPLTADRRRLLDAVDQRVLVVRLAARHLVRAIGTDGVLQEAWLACSLAASVYDPVAYPGVPFPAFACRCVKRRMTFLNAHFGRRGGVWAEDAGVEPADHRGGGVWPALAAWCECRGQRRRLDWRSRVVLYLRCVEGWSLGEIAAVFGVNRQRVSQIIGTATKKMLAKSRGVRP